MRLGRSIRIAAGASLMAVAMSMAAVAADAPAAAQEAKTLDNLQAAFNGESNAHARYLAFAKKADEEGFKGVASLFRAAAKAEEIHAANHAEVIKKLGGTPKADVKTVDVKSTKENLEAALKGESYERDVMYPNFLRQAKAEGNRAAVRTFNFAKEAEAEHAQLYKDALENLDSWKADAKTFLVCPECGYTTLDVKLTECPVCSTPREKFLTVT